MAPLSLFALTVLYKHSFIQYKHSFSTTFSTSITECEGTIVPSCLLELWCAQVTRSKHKKKNSLSLLCTECAHKGGAEGLPLLETVPCRYGCTCGQGTKYPQVLLGTAPYGRLVPGVRGWAQRPMGVSCSTMSPQSEKQRKWPFFLTRKTPRI